MRGACAALGDNADLRFAAVWCDGVSDFWLHRVGQRDALRRNRLCGALPLRQFAGCLGLGCADLWRMAQRVGDDWWHHRCRDRAFHALQGNPAQDRTKASVAAAVEHAFDVQVEFTFCFTARRPIDSITAPKIIAHLTVKDQQHLRIDTVTADILASQFTGRK